MMTLSVSFLEARVLRWLSEGTPLIISYLMSDIYSYCVSRNASVSVLQGLGVLVACRDLLMTFFFKKSLATLMKFNTKPRVCRTNFGIIKFIFADQTPCGGFILYWFLNIKPD